MTAETESQAPGAPSTLPPIHRTALLDGSMAFHAWGEGPTLVLLHGFPDSPASFAALAPRLADAGYRVLAPYLPGYGESTLPPPSDLLAAAGQLEQWLAAVAAPEPVVLIGHDWGSILAQLLLARQRRAPGPACRIEAAVLAAVPPIRTMLRHLTPAQLWRSRYMLYLQLPGIVGWLQRRRLRYLARLWRRWSPMLPRDVPARMAAQRLLSSAPTLRQAIGYYRSLLNPGHSGPRRWGHTLRLLLGRIDRPVLVLAGSGDGCIGPDAFIGARRDCPHPASRQQWLGPCGHFMQLERPALVADSIAAFLHAALPRQIAAAPGK